MSGPADATGHRDRTVEAADAAGEAAACGPCLRRTWLLGRLAGRIEIARHGLPAQAGGRLRELLALPDDELLAALGGREQRRDRARARGAGRPRAALGVRRVQA